jgi:hypothetical protein
MATYVRASLGPELVAQSAQVLQSSTLRQQPHAKLARCLPTSCQRLPPGLTMPANTGMKGMVGLQGSQARLSAPEVGQRTQEAPRMVPPPPVEWIFNETAQRALRLVPDEAEWDEESRGADGCSTSEEREGGWGKGSSARTGRIGGPTFLSSTLQSSSPPKQRQESNERDNFYVNVGDAIRTLREELPGLFYRKPTFGIFRYVTRPMLLVGRAFRIAHESTASCKGPLSIPHFCLAVCLILACYFVHATWLLRPVFECLFSKICWWVLFFSGCI